MSLQGLPDFQAPIIGDGLQIYFPFEGAGSFILVPDHLEIATRVDGRPDFLLQLIRPERPTLPPEPHGILDMRLQPQYRLDGGLILLRQQHSRALLEPALFSGGFLRLRPEEHSADLAADLRVPMPLTWNGLTNARYTLRMSLDSALLLRSALQSDVLALLAQAELEIVGVAPRQPIQVRFNPAALLEELLALGNDRGQVPYGEIVSYFRRDFSALPLEVSGEVHGDDQLAETLTDWVRSRLGSFCAAPDEDSQPFMALPRPASRGSGQFLWDLSQPLQTSRPLVLTLHPLEAARQLVRDGGLSLAVPDPIIVPSMPTGIFEVRVTANLPEQRLGVAAIGVTVRAEPRMPFRPHAVVKTVLLEPPQDMQTVYLQLSPWEELEYTFSTFVVLSTGEQFSNGVGVPHVGARLDLTPDDFPVQFVAIDADRPLLSLSDVHGVLRWTAAGVDSQESFDLTLAHPALALALPRGMDGAALEFEAESHANGKTLRLGPLPAKKLHLGLYLFPAYGPVQVAIDCTFRDGPSVVILDLLPEGRTDSPEHINQLFLTKDQPRRTWSYLAQSPFEAGYRYRLHPRGDDSPSSWSGVRSPFEALTIDNITAL
jgi:hypothetical protein